MTLFDTIKTTFLFALLVYIGPMIVESIKKQYLPFLELHTQIGIIYLNKSITNSYHHTTELHTFFKNPHIKGIVIKIDCSEVIAGTSQILFHEIRHLKKEFPKPIIALVENNCIAGGYLIASACDYIIAPESAIIGGIGSDFLSINHIKYHDELSLQALQQDTYLQIIKHIAMARKLSLTTIAQWADGRIFTGTQALNHGLVNELGSLCTVIKVIKEKALIEGEIEWIENKKPWYCKYWHYDYITSISSLPTSTQCDIV